MKLTGKTKHPKRRRFTAILFIHGITLLLASTCCQAQAPSWLVPPTDSFSSISSYSEGLARVSLWSNRQIYYMDTSGKLKAIAGTYDNAGNFHDGLAWVSEEDSHGKTHYGFINKAGKMVIPCIYGEVQDFSCNRAAVNLKGIWQYINTAGQPAIRDNYIITEMPYINGNHEQAMMEVEPPAFHSDRVLYRGKNGLYGYRDTSGAYIIPAQFDLAHDYSDGVAVVSDTLPEVIIKGNDPLSRLYNRLPSGPTSYKSRVIDMGGQTLFKLDSNITLDMNRNYTNGLCSFLMQGQDSSGWGVMNTKGQIRIAPTYQNEPMPNYDGVSFVQVDGDQSTGNKDGYLLTFDTLGQIIAKIPFRTPWGDLHDSNLGFHDGYMAVQVGDHWGYMDAKGTLVIPPQFDEAMNFQEGFAIVKNSAGKVGIIRNPLKDY